MVISSLISSLILWINANTDFNTKNFKIKVTELSSQKIQKLACGGKCPIVSFFNPKKGIFITKMDYENNYCNQSILLHELIHALQNFENSKKENIFREKEAYEIQNRFLKEKSINQNFKFLNVKICRRLQNF